MQAQKISDTNKRKTYAGSAESWQHFISPAVFALPAVFPVSAWSEHIPFAYWIIESLQPRILVELGTHFGLSYLCFCQAVASSNLQTKCFAVDNWTGDEHTGFYDPSVFEFVNASNKPYEHFSTLYQSSFAAAVPSFKNESIDLLHIDGLHTYDAVRNDFYSWLPKLSQQSIVLFHDIKVIDRGFGVYRLWEELTQQFPFFEFPHGYGLGVLGIGKKIPEKLIALFELSQFPEMRDPIQEMYARMGILCRKEQAFENARSVAVTPDIKIEIPPIASFFPTLQQITTQVFWKNGDEHFDENKSIKQEVILNNKFFVQNFQLNKNNRVNAIRIDPVAAQGAIYLHAIKITNEEEIVFSDWKSMKGACSINNLLIIKSALLKDAYVLLSLTIDPIIEIALPPTGNWDSINIGIIFSKIDNESLCLELEQASKNSCKPVFNEM